MVTHYAIVNGSVVPADEAGGSIRVYVSPTREEIETLKTRHGIDEHTLHSALDPDEIPRLEFESDHFAVIWKRPLRFIADGSPSFDVMPMGVFVYKDSMEIIMPEQTPLFEGRHFHRVSSNLDLMLRLLSRTIYHFLGHLKVIDTIFNEIKQKVNTSMENKYLIQMFDLSESLVYYLNAISSNGAVLGKLRNNAVKIGFTAEELEFLDDVQIDNGQCYKQADIFSSILTGLMDARGNLVNNNVNTLLKRLTIINTIFLPLNLLASIGGMSEYSQWTQGMNWLSSYSLFMVGMVCIGAVTYAAVNPTLFKRKLR